jgi:hypothetical protein
MFKNVLELTTNKPARRRSRRKEEMNDINLDWLRDPSKRIIVIGGHAHGKTFFSRLWMQWNNPELVSKQLIRRLAAEAVINISINS